MTCVVDASAVLAVILDEPGATAALSQFEDSTISAVNLSEVYRKLVDGGVPIAEAVLEVGRFGFKSVPFDEKQAVEAARLRPLTKHLGLSLADRACLGLANLTTLPILTSDRRMAEAKDVLGLDIRMIR